MRFDVFYGNVYCGFDTTGRRDGRVSRVSRCLRVMMQRRLVHCETSSTQSFSSCAAPTWPHRSTTQTGTKHHTPLLSICYDRLGGQQGRNFYLKSGAYKNSTCGAHRARRKSEKIFEFFCSPWCISQPYFFRWSALTSNWRINLVSVSGENIKLTNFYQKLCHACPKSGGGALYPPLQSGGYAYPPYSTHSTPMLDSKSYYDISTCRFVVDRPFFVDLL